ncbi:FliG C-terminal domain-containing protein [Ferrimonas balearica]|uniref:FliG C-terminal domain-containing protein n=1 Tax=Ferrimonas balearica TaxID=44012 RepID=UPI001C55B8BF|nr:FliG C-terminal domain-containing protein [Ferrimonas balearica]MBW3139427.1 flagellar motor switch protein FliG [Ferrimonas balearica]MBY5980677.1 flagellar motor switch protein FliG [Ferrimonas balearica]MBY6106495.1 flagellar motor switch protein FliG [Ferrimonas balearica]
MSATNSELATQLGGVEQAAMLLVSMGEQGAAKVLANLSSHQVQQVSQMMARLSNVRQEDAQSVLQRFFSDYRAQAGIARASRGYLQRTLDLALGDKLAKGLLDSIYGDEVKTLVQRLEWVEPALLARQIAPEHPQLQAVLLGLLPPESASQVLQRLPVASHDELLVRIAQLGELDRQVIEELKELVDRCLIVANERSHTRVTGVRQVAGILNRFSGDRSQLMEMIKLHDQGLAVEVEANMFDFIILARQSDETLQHLLQEVPQEVLALAMKGIDSDFKRRLMSALPKRMSQALELQVDTLGPVPLSRADGARAEVMAIARRMMSEGEIELQLYEEQVVE